MDVDLEVIEVWGVVIGILICGVIFVGINVVGLFEDDVVEIGVFDSNELFV